MAVAKVGATSPGALQSISFFDRSTTQTSEVGESSVASTARVGGNRCSAAHAKRLEGIAESLSVRSGRITIAILDR
jgi:hypothetical protein